MDSLKYVYKKLVGYYYSHVIPRDNSEITQSKEHIWMNSRHWGASEQHLTELVKIIITELSGSLLLHAASTHAAPLNLEQSDQKRD